VARNQFNAIESTADQAQAFVEHVVPLLQRRGLMRTEYAGRTFRENINQA